jgi:hypothetical protein
MALIDSCSQKAMYETAQGGCGDPRHRGASFGRERSGDLAQRVQAAHVDQDVVFVVRAAGQHLVQERQIEEYVGIGSDEDVLAHGFGALDAPRVDEHDAPAALFNGRKTRRRMRQMDEAHARNGGVRADHDQTIGVIDVGKRLQEREAVHALRDGELVVAVLRTRLEEVA